MLNALYTPPLISLPFSAGQQLLGVSKHKVSGYSAARYFVRYDNTNRMYFTRFLGLRGFLWSVTEFRNILTLFDNLQASCSSDDFRLKGEKQGCC